MLDRIFDLENRVRSLEQLLAPLVKKRDEEAKAAHEEAVARQQEDQPPAAEGASNGVSA